MKNRSVVEIMVLVFTFLVAFMIVAAGITIAIVEIMDPKTDTDAITQSLLSLISGILGALLGLIAGKSQATQDLDVRPSDREPKP